MVCTGRTVMKAEGDTMKALVLESTGNVSLRDMEIDEQLGPKDVRIRPLRIGICGSDIHYYLHGEIGDFKVKEPMVLGHEASGVVVETGSEVTRLKKGDRVCMEPGIPEAGSPQVREGQYNLDPAVRFWATPPIHGCMRETVVHPEAFTYKLPENVSLEEGALVEPAAIGVYAAVKARIEPGDTALVMGAGTIGIVTALAASAAGCGRVYITDIKKEKLQFVEQHYAETLIPVRHDDLDKLAEQLGAKAGGGADVAFDATGAPPAISRLPEFLKPGGRIVLVGMPAEPVGMDVVQLQVKEIEISTIFRYVNVFDRTVELIASKKLNVKPLHTHTFPFSDSCRAVEFAAEMPADAVKIMIDMEK